MNEAVTMVGSKGGAVWGWHLWCRGMAGEACSTPGVPDSVDPAGCLCKGSQVPQAGPKSSAPLPIAGAGRQSWPLGAGEIEAIQVHHLGPGRHEVLHELIFPVRTGIHLGQCP